jgi:hypothetical protein
MNRVTTILPPAGTQSTSYGYDPVGRLTSAVSGISTWSSTYNFRGMLTSEALQLVGQNAWGLGYAHDANGSLSLIHYPDGENVSYAPDALGRPTQAGSYASSVGYFPNGQVAQFAYANGTSYVAAQNARQKLQLWPRQHRSAERRPRLRSERQYQHRDRSGWRTAQQELWLRRT